MNSSRRDNILLILILAIFLWIGGKELWAFDRYSTPTFTASWLRSQTAPEFNRIPATSPTLGIGPHISDNDTQLRLYEDTCEVVLYSPGTNRGHVIPADSIYKARRLYYEIALRYTYYIAKDRTIDIFAADNKGTLQDILAGPKFLEYLYKADSNNGYGVDDIHNKYNLDGLTVVYNYDEYLKYVRGFTYTSKYDYLDNNDLKGMGEYIQKVYSIYTIRRNWFIDPSGGS